MSGVLCMSIPPAECTDCVRESRWDGALVAKAAIVARAVATSVVA